MYEEHNRFSRQKVLKLLITTQMTKIQQVHDHAMKMMGYINELEALGSQLDEDAKTDAIINSQSPSFNQWSINQAEERQSIECISLSQTDQTLEEELSSISGNQEQRR
ncbi:PREDICTED: uncharacterized protein LOC104608781 [Nelumbo nucifera]|uniref:Uncharacterized protein LOC104608781 n=1 Tax=Nelumbo nucifera TaxID=4432 RepID=A0A1U8B1T9_NELNU|nr:PREDICTED: uncharacterized protein LOC104608781 [Nelumbo nucifera]